MSIILSLHSAVCSMLQMPTGMLHMAEAAKRSSWPKPASASLQPAGVAAPEVIQLTCKLSTQYGYDLTLERPVPYLVCSAAVPFSYW